MAGMRATTEPGHTDPEVVSKAEAVFKELGMTAQEAVAIFYKQTALRGAFPITELIPNEETQEAIRNAQSGREIATYKSVAEVMAEYRNARIGTDDEI